MWSNFNFIHKFYPLIPKGLTFSEVTDHRSTCLAWWTVFAIDNDFKKELINVLRARFEALLLLLLLLFFYFFISDMRKIWTRMYFACITSVCVSVCMYFSLHVAKSYLGTQEKDLCFNLWALASTLHSEQKVKPMLNKSIYFGYFKREK